MWEDVSDEFREQQGADYIEQLIAGQTVEYVKGRLYG